jgi:hypothetical protein
MDRWVTGRIGPDLEVEFGFFNQSTTHRQTENGKRSNIFHKTDANRLHRWVTEWIGPDLEFEFGFFNQQHVHANGKRSLLSKYQ